MLLYHTTPGYNRGSIEENGIKVAYSQGKLAAVWLHTEEKTSWAYLHCVRRHGCKVQGIVTFAVEVDENLVKRSAADGLFYVMEDVRPEYIRGIFGFELVSKSPLEAR